MAGRLNRHQKPATARAARIVKRSAWTMHRDDSFGAHLRLRRWVHRNGLTVLAVRDTSAPVVSYQTWYHVGSRHEQPGKTGLAHFFEHMMFNATRNHPQGEFDALLEAAGAENNAATWTDWTYYYENVPKRELSLVIELEADRMRNLLVRKQQIESEREVVLNERRYRVEDDAEGLAAETLYAHALRKHPYRWPTIGWREDIENYSIKDCQRFYKTHYAPNNATIVVVGDFLEGVLLELVDTHYGTIRKAKVPAYKHVREPVQRAERKVSVKFPTPTDKVLLGYRAPAFAHRDTPALTVASEILFGGRSSRMDRALCREQELLTGIRGSAAPFREPGLFEIWMPLREGKRIKDVMRAFESELTRFLKKGPSADELERAKSALELSAWQTLETASGKAEQIGFYEVVVGNGAAVFDVLESYQTITVDDVLAVSRRYLDRKRRTSVFVEEA